MSEENSGASASANTADMAQAATSELTDTGEGLQSTDPAKPTEAVPAEVKKQEAEIKKMMKSYELQVNGKSKKIEVDTNNDDEVKKYIQKALAADEKFQEAATYRKQAEQLVELLQTDPLKVLRNPALGLDIRKMAEQILINDLEEQQKTPEQKELEEARQKLKDFEEDKKRSEDERKQAIFQQKLTEQQQITENSIITAIDNSSLPASPYAVRRVADIMVSAVENGWEDVTIEKIMPYAEEIIMGELQQIFTKHNTPEKLEKIVGKEHLNNYRKSVIAKVKATPKTASQLGESTAKDVKDPQAPAPKRIKVGSSIW